MSAAVLLVIVSSLQHGRLVTHTQAFETEKACEAALTTAAEGSAIVFSGNVNSTARPVLISKDGWRVLQTPVGRVVAAFKCVNYQK